MPPTTSMRASSSPSYVPTGGGAVSLVHLSQQKPDGCALAWTSNQISTTYHGGQLLFDYTNFTHIARVSVETPVLAVKADAPWKNLKEMIDDAKANPEKVRIGNSGAGSHTHFSAVALFADAGGAKTIDVPFNAAEATVNLLEPFPFPLNRNGTLLLCFVAFSRRKPVSTLLENALGGHIEGAVQLPAAFVSHVKAGTLRILGAMGADRDPVFPDVPTAKEQGYDVQLELWRGVSAPRGVPADVVAKLEKAIGETVASPEFAEAGKTLGFRPAFLAGKDFEALIATDDK